MASDIRKCPTCQRPRELIETGLCQECTDVIAPSPSTRKEPGKEPGKEPCPRCRSSRTHPTDYDQEGMGRGIGCASCGYDSDLREQAGHE